MSILELLQNINIIIARKKNILAILEQSTITVTQTIQKSKDIKLTEDECKLIGKTEKNRYINWINKLITSYKHPDTQTKLEIKNFVNSFKDGYVLCALAEKLTGKMIYDSCKDFDPRVRNNKGLEILNSHGVKAVIKPDDEWIDEPEDLSTQTYIFGVYNKFCLK